jgi:cytochrome b subunit of formate dehydrogenase
MTPFTVRRSLHLIHALTTVLLIGTGLLISYPDLRGSLIGGYGREVLEWHVWVGWLFMGAPPLALALNARPLLRDLRRRLGPPDPVYAWRKIHIVTTLVLTFLVGASGVVLWLDLDLPLAFIDAMLEIHIVITWVLLVSIPIHVALAWRKTVARTREMLGIDPIPGSGFPGDDDDFDPLQPGAES